MLEFFFLSMYSLLWMYSMACFMTWKLAATTLMVQTKAFWSVASQTCLINHCSTLLRMVPNSMGHIAFPSAIRWMHHTTVSITAIQLESQTSYGSAFTEFNHHLTKYCRSEAALACSMRAKQRHHIPQCPLVQTLVLVVLANLAIGPFLA